MSSSSAAVLVKHNDGFIEADVDDVGRPPFLVLLTPIVRSRHGAIEGHRAAGEVCGGG